MANLGQIVYISSADYATLLSTGTVTVGGVTITYSPNDVYVTPDDSYVKPSGGIPDSDLASTFVKPVTNPTANHLAGLDASGNLTDSGVPIGTNITASGNSSHAEGYGTTASGFASHAEGENTAAAGSNAHSEGYGTDAGGYVSHAEGYKTISGSNYQHAQGSLNIVDYDDTYAHIVGNGVENGSGTTRSNAHTLDWQGNAWFAGDVYVGSTSGTNKDAGSKKLAIANSIKTSMDSVATVNTEYYLGTQSTVSITLPNSANAGQIISVVFYSGSTATTLSISGTTIGDIVTPSTNQRVEINMLYDGTYWAIVSNIMAVTA